jgi:CheY-like chemotaxis protein
MNQIILIDDDPVVLFLHHALLKRMNTESMVLSFDDGDLALAHIQSEPAASFLILLDINMPVCDGWTFLVELRKVSSFHGKIVLVTSSIDLADQNRAKAFPEVAGYLEKPLTAEKLTPYLF